LGFLCSYNDDDESLRIIAARKILNSGHSLTVNKTYEEGYYVLAAFNNMNKLALILQRAEAGLDNEGGN